ncbi:MAG TPA: hypothetical protein VHT74_00835 [Acetobacteraceae bacterium]|jgi:hypothetical protein|nr:hypothetical protein [Acetobacteraceae bacterium]
MPSVEDRLTRLTIAAVPAVIVAVGYCLSLLPRSLVIEMLSILALWLSLALPLGIVVGHCALSEGEY